jgi:cytochrome c
MKKMSLFATLMASAALAACGGGEEAAEDTAAPASDATEVAAAETEAPAEAEAPAPEPEPEPEPEPAPEPEPEAEPEAMAEPAADPAPAGDGPFTINGIVGDAAAGRRVFSRCQTCHVLQEGVNRVGPSLYGIFGRTAGTVEGFRYSEANSNSGIVWSGEIMFEYLENPREYMPGTNMAFPGLRSEEDRANVIAYIKENGGVAE